MNDINIGAKPGSSFERYLSLYGCASALHTFIHNEDCEIEFNGDLFDPNCEELLKKLKKRTFCAVVPACSVGTSR